MKGKPPWTRCLTERLSDTGCKVPLPPPLLGGEESQPHTGIPKLEHQRLEEESTSIWQKEQELVCLGDQDCTLLILLERLCCRVWVQKRGPWTVLSSDFEGHFTFLKVLCRALVSDKLSGLGEGERISSTWSAGLESLPKSVEPPDCSSCGFSSLEKQGRLEILGQHNGKLRAQVELEISVPTLVRPAAQSDLSPTRG